MESITLVAPDTAEEITVYVLEETTLNQQKYLLVISVFGKTAGSFLV